MRSRPSTTRIFKGTASVAVRHCTRLLPGSRPRCTIAPASPAALPAVLRDLRLKDDAGRQRTLAEFHDRKALVLIFLGAECPISNSYADTLAALAKRYAPRGAQFLGVNAIPDEDLAAV